MISSRKSKAIGLFSGGLDSLLAVRLITEQDIDVVALHFKLPFLAPGRAGAEDRFRKMAQFVGANLVAVDVAEDYLATVRTPQFGYARGAAPCVDCILYMLRQARELAREISADFIFTGEVVGQRSHCQNKRSLRLIEKQARMDGRLLRPLSAKLLEPTIPELTGAVRRERLLDLKGRGRRRQIRLAHEYGIIDYSPPTGGCLLIDSNVARRVRDAVENDQLDAALIPLLRHGRHFRLPSGAKVIVGRHQRENARIEALAAEGDLLCRPVELMGPVVLVRSEKQTKKDIELAARICARYSDTIGSEPAAIDCGGAVIKVKPPAADEFDEWLLRPSPEPEEPEAVQEQEQPEEPAE